MKVILKHLGLPSTRNIESWVENQIASLQPRVRIEQARVFLSLVPNASPAYHAHVHIVTPGPDLFAESRDHTLAAAMSKAMKQLQERVRWKSNKRLQRLKSNISAPSAKKQGLRHI